ncbi:hypothetical protein F5Y15DRAFT_49000 [Xylariaceae sp. FL0016]|nr:hypothetical protein F5Y15DRAFT_49000 [Xylariaceae sp. FL0016]
MYAQMKTLVIVALLGSSALAAPKHHHKRSRKPCKSVAAATPAVKAAETYAVTSSTAAAETAVTVYPTTAETPTSTSTSASATATSTSSGVDYMATVNEWRSKMNLPELTYKASLESQCQQTLNNWGDQTLSMSAHELSGDAMAQVLADGDWTAGGFATAYVQEWLCEKPSLTGLDGVCESSPTGETGHADILTSTDYKSIGCAGAYGHVGCSLGFDA